MADPTGPPPHSFTGILKDIEHQNPPRESDDVSQGHEEHYALSEKASSHRRSKPASIDIDKTQPQDFDGELSTNNELPSANVQKMIEDYIVLDRHGKSRTFKSLYMGNNKARRVLVIFIRHFFCGNCQEYLRTLSEHITPDSLLRLPISTFITVVGCGDPALIDMYAKETGCQFPIYTDPTRSLFDALGMVKTLNMGDKPAYAKKSTSRGIFDSIVQGLKQVPKGLALKSGDHRQVGGEFLYEPFQVSTPVTTPHEEQHPQFGTFERPENGNGNGKAREEEERAEEKRITWCHRMKTTRDHVEIPELMEVLGLDSQAHVPAPKDEKRWVEATRERKGTGVTMAPEMKRLSQAARESAEHSHEPVAAENN
ncbi:Thioredoxin-like protein AAED1 [Trichoderma lentiforme]|uniref:Thioredoxin-like protein AAED1 n=1 Tax=Trichoderma lentiforme TaxID=1567552 RepID=A0A9P4XG61_9HYPO|nr:Thioredoxin-like protein AAED1 [Trichoderma lentiforme]